MTFDFNFYKSELIQSEGVSYDRNTGNGAYGAFQFIPSTIDWVASLLGQVAPTIEDFLKNPSQQDLYLQTYVDQTLKYIQSNGLDKYIGQPVTGRGNKISTTMNIYGLVAGAHLGGNGNLREFLVNGIDHTDHTNAKTGGTFISDYIAKFSQLADEKKKTINSDRNINVDIPSIENSLVNIQKEIENIKKVLG